MSIESQPPGASVFINGRLAGKTPVRIAGLPSGSYSLRMEKENYSTLSMPIVLGMKSLSIHEALPPRGAGTLRVAVEPAGAEVLLDGELIGHTPLEENNIPTGSHELLIRKTNFKAFTTRAFPIQKPAGRWNTKISCSKILSMTMLQNSIDKDNQRVAHYMDMGRYLFTNNKIKDSGDFYVRGLQVADQKLTFPNEATPADERLLEQQLRERDRERIHDELRKIMANHGKAVPEKDMALFIERINRQIEVIAVRNESSSTLKIGNGSTSRRGISSRTANTTRPRCCTSSTSNRPRA